MTCHLQVLEPGAFLDIAQSPSKGLTLWELDRLSRERTVENMLNAISTLNSLATLITNLESMVVLDHIRDKVRWVCSQIPQIILIW